MREQQGDGRAQAKAEADGGSHSRFKPNARQETSIGEATTNTTHTDSDETALPEALRSRYADTIANTRAQVLAQSPTEQAGIALDRHVRAVMNEARTTGANPSAATAAAYRRDHQHMRAAGMTPLEKSTTFQHFNRLRSAYRFAELEAIEALRKRAEVARKAKDRDGMRALTQAAFERACVFRALFLADDRPVWSHKAAALRAEGKRPPSKSKRHAAKSAPTPDQLLVALGNQRGRYARVERFAMCFALFGIRPAELMRGVAFNRTPEGLTLVVRGAKVDARRGQPTRTLEIAPSRLGQSGMAAQFLRDEAARMPMLRASPADILAVRRAMREVQAGLSPYAYRHARASDAKASQSAHGVAAWLGHASDRAQSTYGNKRSAKGGVIVKSASATRAIRHTKTLPLSDAQRFAKVSARLCERLQAHALPRGKSQPSRTRGPRL